MDFDIIEMAESFEKKQFVPEKTAADMRGQTVFVDAGFTPYTYDDMRQQHSFFSLESFIAWVQSEYDKAKAAIFWSENQILAVLDRNDNDASTATYKYKMSRQVESWMGLTKRSLSQKNFKEFLECRLTEYNDGESQLFAAMAQLKLAKQIKYEAAVDDGNNISVAFEMKDGKGTTKIAKELIVTVPMFQGDDTTVSIPFKVKYGQPVDEDTRPLFSLECPEWDEIYDSEMKRQIEKLEGDLKGYFILNGNRGEKNVARQPFRKGGHSPAVIEFDPGEKQIILGPSWDTKD